MLPNSNQSSTVGAPAAFTQRVLGALTDKIADWLELLRQFDQVHVGVAHVNRTDRPLRADTQQRTHFDCNSQPSQLLDRLVQGDGQDEAQIQRTGSGQPGPRRELIAECVDVELLRPEFEGKNIVIIIPDFAERYLSTALFEGL